MKKLLLAAALFTSMGANADPDLERLRSLGVALNEMQENGIHRSCIAYAEAVEYAAELRDMKLNENDVLTIISQMYFMTHGKPKIWLDVWQNFGRFPPEFSAKTFLLNRIRKEVYQSKKAKERLKTQENDYCLEALAP